MRPALIPVHAALLLLASVASAQSQRISGELAHTPATLGGDVDEVFFSPDGSRLLYLADEDVTGRRDLYSAPADGSAPAVRLSASLPGSLSWPLERRFTPSRVLFQRSAKVYSAPLDGSTSTLELSGDFVLSYELTPDGDTLVWLGGDSAVTRAVLARPTDGSAPATTLLPDGDYDHLEIAPSGDRVVVSEFVECFPTDDPYVFICVSSLLALPIDGSAAPVSLNPGLPSLSGHAITPDSSLVVFAALSGLEEMVLYRVPLDGSSAPVAFSGAIPFSTIELTVSPGGDRVVYLDDSGELYSVPIDGSAAPSRLNGNLVAGGAVHSFQIAPDGTRVVYLADQQVLDQLELYRVPIEDGFAVKLSGTTVVGGDVQEDYQIAPDSVGVVFRADRLTDEVFELFAVPFSGGVVRIHPPAVQSGDVQSFQVSADSTRVAYRGDMEVNSLDELFSVPITGGASTKLNGPLVSGGDVRPSYAVSSDSSRAAYVADELVDQIDEAFVAPLAGGPSVRVNGTLDFGPPSGDVTTYAALPGSSGAVYIADGDDEDVFELYRTHIGGSPVTKLNGPLIPEGDVTHVVVTPAGSHVLYLADADHDERFDLFVVPADGSEPAVQLSQPIAWFEDVRSPEVTSDGSRVVYTVASPSSSRLYSAPVAGGAPVQLTPNGGAFVLSADGTRVVYRTAEDVYAVPTDGSGPEIGRAHV